MDEQVVRVTRISGEQVVLEASRHDRSAQQVVTQHILISQSEVRLDPVKVRYSWPAELDLMARLAGMRLRERWSD
jgi:hypothetical protein